MSDADVLDLACAVEMLHEASLLHDDICDGSLIRRGGPSVAASSGTRTAALAGLHMAGAALRLFADVLGRNPVVAAQVSAPWGVNELHRVGELALGQIIESVPPTATDLAGLRRNYRLVAVAKTGTLFRLACAHGGAAAGCDRDGLRALARYADHLAVAFQIMDDIHDVQSPTGTDLAGHITTWPVLEWLGSRPNAAEQWRAAGAAAANLDRIRADVVGSGAVELARTGAAREAEAARAALDGFPDTDGHRHLAELCSAVLAR
ncbi:geranylgeranyl pyrophosphate synthase [Allocatelliglobosispora scoriae]|uniref:Geranylgeranyl pyrophosphate synthase n=1 Tax=Allocatelliglobosispora scoriae TaxID=643052 RepID=A0A841C2X8_9ACTN|nr:polyprenyl synthetase family protein [Allocatelliglobosispora scoriae]MBB5874265.1 geranylgeranyl pyrophosphate synthase [Allocatelliglobosispora scoriae]